MFAEAAVGFCPRRWIAFRFWWPMGGAGFFLGLALFAYIKGRDPCHGLKLSQGIGKILARRAPASTPVRHASRNSFV
jgi:hypothetical protein